MTWRPSDLPDLTGKTALITGANSGLGLASAVEIARKGARVIMACRDPERAANALTQVKTEFPAAQAEILPLDLASLASVKTAAEAVDSVDIVLCNAGVMAIPRRLTEDGFEMQLGTNHLGHFALVGHLMPKLRASKAPRVVVTSSFLHETGVIRFGDLMGERRYNNWLAYGQSKLANLLFMRELARRTPVFAAAAHPGYASTNLQSGQGLPLTEQFMRFGNRVFAVPAERGAWPQEYAAASPEAQSGQYYGPSGPFMRGAPGKARMSGRARNEATAKRLWDVSEELTGVSYAR